MQTTKYIRFQASFAENTDKQIKDAFSISPTQGIGEEEFQIVVKNVTLIDFENEFWHYEKFEPKPVSFNVSFLILTEMKLPNPRRVILSQLKTILYEI